MAGRAEQIGEIEILARRVYRLDAEATDPHATTVVVEPGRYPIYRDGFSTFWSMQGNLNRSGFWRMGDGMFGVHAGDEPSDIEVTFPSKRFGEDEWAELLAGPEFAEGQSTQRLRVHLWPRLVGRDRLPHTCGVDPAGICDACDVAEDAKAVRREDR